MFAPKRVWIFQRQKLTDCCMDCVASTSNHGALSK